MARRGGSRKHPAGCTCVKCPKMGRPKLERPTNANVAHKVLAECRAEETWLSMIALEKRRLGIGENGKLLRTRGGKVDEGEYRGNFSIIPLTNLLRYLEDRAYGRPVDTVNHLHDKPIEMNVNLNLAERIASARKKLQR